MKKHLINDNFLRIYKSYYPESDDFLSKIKLQNTIKKYIYDINPPHTINFLQHMSPGIISMERTINQLTSKYENMYMMHHSESDEKLFNWENLCDIMHYQISITAIFKFIKYLNFMNTLRSRGYKKISITSSIRIWKHSSIFCHDQGRDRDQCKDQDQDQYKDQGQYKDRDRDQDVNFVFISNEQIQEIIDHKFEIQRSDVLIEIKGFSDYSVLFDIVTLDTFNDYLSFEENARSLSQVFDLFSTSRINIHASDITTMIIPFVVNYFQERIHTIQIKDPIFYPYSFHTFFINLRKDQGLNTKIGTQYNLLSMLNDISLIHLFIDPEMCDKKNNLLYQTNTTIILSDDKFVDKNNLMTLLGLYSNCNVMIDG